ncbi:MAG TPA: type II CAAX endopeptidase family protein [Gaiellaceae bacterium]|jgi:membrane protease YdiL (CAAX protease family)|nr:type II CAAX endopeptidase family protein [Gaiellaceae bacterium]
MQTTSSETSARLSTGSNRNALVAWLCVAAAFVALGFIGASSGQTDPNVLYEYSFAAGSTVIYAVLVTITLVIANLIGSPTGTTGLNRFSWRWVWIALGLIVLVLVFGAALEPVLHAGKEQGLEPDVWRPDRAGAFALNALVAATVVPFAEELFFRGLGVRALLPFGGSAAVWITAIAFGLGHGLLVALPVLIPFGLVLGWVRLRSGSMWPGMLAHGFYNGSALLYVYFHLT